MTGSFPLIGIAPVGDGTSLGALLSPTAQTVPIAPRSSGGTLDAISKAGGMVTGALGKAYSAVSGNSFLGALFGSDYQYITGIIGLILIAAGIFLFRPVRETVIEAGKTAAKGAALAA